MRACPAPSPAAGRAPGRSSCCEWAWARPDGEQEAAQALYAIGQRRGLDRSAVQARVQQRLGKAVEALTSREASGLIRHWRDQ